MKRILLFPFIIYSLFVKRFTEPSLGVAALAVGASRLPLFDCFIMTFVFMAVFSGWINIDNADA
jgi:hypothetical protein